ncbi:hypothetical protein Poli38472_001707 [Pythium oligandrum]|uniref:Uncharacterized protein n=1 Tax=Pythium oligandrum TaxID=41045 RepID=A0A8K1CVU8_PYTOL|nr:hypothetical protein Poli38472_001707 [Pythium oligandrum]|eukprot:TMW69551.1 hypothetical protein Poli38472_001707 [Pythium oligandrum]
MPLSPRSLHVHDDADERRLPPSRTPSSSSLLSIATSRLFSPVRRLRSTADVYASMPVTPVLHDDAASTETVGFFPCYTPSQLRQRFIQIQVVDQRFKEPSWMHPNIGGEAQHVTSVDEEVESIRLKLEVEKQNLSEWPSTAISGNDILSSVLFTAGLTIAKAGKLAIVAQLLVVIVVYCCRWVMEEVVSAVPLNGGCYNAILNSSSKKVAAIAATFSILSYLATGVVCGVSAFNYVNSLVAIPVVGCAIALLFFFALLCLVGIAESAIVALIIFVFHACTLTVLCITSSIYAIQHSSIFWDNMKVPLPDTAMAGYLVDGNVFSAIFLGFGPALLSVTGFESSAQFVEEQAPGVFPKTLRNMWALSSTFNMAITMLSLAVLPMKDINANSEVLLAMMGRITSGRWLEVLVTVDAFMVLAGAVLTSYVGINGLAQRLAIDRVLPRFLLQKNSWRQTHHFIIFSYFLVGSSLVLAMNGGIAQLSGVFAFAFLGVMVSFVVGCILLKLEREEIPRETSASWTNATFCLVMLLLGMISNAVGDPTSFGYFAAYFVGVGVIVGLMLERVRLLKALLYVSKQVLLYFKYKRHGKQQPVLPQNSLATTNSRGQGIIGSVFLAKAIEKIKKTPVIFFCKEPNLPKINEAISYVIQNEQTYCLRLVHVTSEKSDNAVPREFEDIVCLFDHIYPSIKIDFVSVTGTFEPALIEWISLSMSIPVNMMLMRQPADAATHRVASLGVRVITS